MRNVLKKLLLVSVASLLVFSFAACNKSDNGEITSSSDTEGEVTQTVADNTQYYDEVTKTLKLTKDYEGLSFLSDGIGKANVNAYTDGDTTRFRLESGEVVIIRYYSVDTPESTGSVEKWGKAASNFTKSRLSEATEIVLEATGDHAVHDSYGTRYLGYVWYKTEGGEFKNLNLELVENGFSENKGINTSDYPYYSYFNKANLFARSIKLRLYSDLEDPLYSTDPVDFSIKEFENNPDLYYNEDTEAGAKVKFVAALTNLYVSDSGTYTFTATEYDKETGESRTINVYAGYSSAAASKMKLGHLYTIVGNLQKYGGKFQVSGVSYNSIYNIEGKGYTTVKQKNYYLTFNNDISYGEQYSACFYGDATVVSSEIKDGKLTVKATAYQKTKEGYSEEAASFDFVAKVTEDYRNTLKPGMAFSVSGYKFDENSDEIYIPDVFDIKIK